MKALIAAFAMVSAAGVDVDRVSVSARIDADKLIVGQEAIILVNVDLRDGLSASDAGIPAPLLQIQVPRSVRLSGKHLTKYRELSRNEFLQAPFERMIEASPLEVGFKLLRKPRPDDVIHLNVLAYVSDGEDVRFVRRRVAVKLEAGAVAEAVDATRSDWGTGDLLQIGSKAAGFELPRADGSTVSLGQFLGKKNVVVTTYRAFW